MKKALAALLLTPFLAVFAASAFATEATAPATEDTAKKEEEKKDEKAAQ